MQLGVDADGALLQRALDGQSVDDGGIAALVTIARELEALDQRGLEPRRAFVAELRQRLVDEPASSGGTSADRGPAVVRFGRRAWVLVAAAATLLVIAGGLGALSRSALPGDRLYPVKQLIDGVVLELHRDPVGLGRAHLDQAREHVVEAEQLVARSDAARRAGTATGGEPEPADDRAAEDAVDLARALDAATESSITADGVLREAYHSAQRGDALTSLSDFYAEVVPTVDALETAPLPPVAAAAWQRLHDALARGRDDTLRELVACSTCGEASAAARALLARTLPPARVTGEAAGAPTTPGSTKAGGPTRESSARPSGRTPTSTDRATAEGSSGPRPTGGGGSSGSSPSGAPRLPTVGTTRTRPSAGGGGVTLPAPLPTVSLPEVDVSTGITLGGGGITLPGATVSLPTVVVPLPQPPP
jgi:hypothetical protein